MVGVRGRWRGGWWDWRVVSVLLVMEAEGAGWGVGGWRGCGMSDGIGEAG